MRPVVVGIKGIFSAVVRPEHLANRFKDPILPPVLATPVMLLFMENAALEALRTYLEPGESVVGIGANIRHLAATGVGQRVVAEATLVELEGRRFKFDVLAHDESELIGSGTHERMLVDLERFQLRLAAKTRPN